VVVAILGIGAFLLLGGDDDDGVAADDTTTTTEEVTTTTAEATTTTEAETTTTEADETTTTAGDTGTTGVPGEAGFTQIRDDTGELVVEVPDTWTDVDGSPLNANSPNVQASTDLAGFRGLAASGISYSRLENPNVDVDATLDFLMSGQVGNCTVGDRVDYSDAIFTGRIQFLSNCAPGGGELRILVANATDGRAVEVSTYLVAPDGDDVHQHILDTFTLVQG
jgi:hypothetical protein